MMNKKTHNIWWKFNFGTGILTLSLIKYEEITILSHRKYFGRRFNVIDEIDPFLIINIIEDLVSSKNFNMILYLAIPTYKAEYKILNYGMDYGTKLMNFICCHENIVVIIVGSCISLIPFYNNSI